MILCRSTFQAWIFIRILKGSEHSDPRCSPCLDVVNSCIEARIGPSPFYLIQGSLLMEPFLLVFFVTWLDIKRTQKRCEAKLQKIGFVAQKVSHAIKKCFLLVQQFSQTNFSYFGIDRLCVGFEFDFAGNCVKLVFVNDASTWVPSDEFNSFLSPIKNAFNLSGSIVEKGDSRR